MRKLWKHYSYAMILIGLSCISAVILSIHFHSFDKDKYVKVTITEGDSLWKIANVYSKEKSLSNEEFVTWVKKHNSIQGDQIFPGEEIVIPISKQESVMNELASAATE
ncbi:LysM peptidoglycan-binding domain-containing protein [Neobacillus sp. PS3-40]|uniref:cell division suppressor protein YneA n=1 Tax=Neobacillus sp. PS3-40 TaxID=3070679 RepID=UPI0027DEE5E4|nr:LysM peptidoglycan-binding domain-containing protein [Neobacillus sp. PS3-40]WML43808.1 LysM peptidoglycan-binding domain-containing protein [Neobacillus sp. PS3-40]